MSEIHLVPDYLPTDFLSMKDRLTNLMKNTDIFRDYNYEGANITMLLELVSYVGDLSTFYLNEVAKNVYPDTANVYETTHSLSSQRGYQPLGYISADVELKVTVKRYNNEMTHEFYKEGDQLYIPAWYPLDTGVLNVDGNNIMFTTTLPHTITIPLSGNIDTYQFSIPIKQGIPVTVTYSGDDIVDGSIILPFKKFDMGTYPYDESSPSIEVYVNGDLWARVNSFYDELSGLNINDKIYKLSYDKYGRYNIQFSTARNMPNDRARIRAVLIDSYGSNGTLGANLLVRNMGQETIMSENVPILSNGNWIIVDTPFIMNLTKSAIVDGKQISYTNESASVNGSDPETMQEIKENSKSIVNSQSRNVTKSDYVGDLESRSDIIKANVWGEQEVFQGRIYDFNRIYISVVPKDWVENTIPLTSVTWTDPMVPDISQEIQVPSEFNDVFKDSIKRYLEPKKIMSTYEEFVVPDLVYFKFEVGILPKRVYNINNIIIDVKRKLTYYFDWTNRSFGDTIDFRDIHNFIVDSTIVLGSDKFENVRGIQNFTFRDIALYSTKSNQSDPMMIFQLNTSSNFPMFTVSEFDSRYDNTLKPIKLGLNQFPVLASDMCIFINEA